MDSELQTKILKLIEKESGINPAEIDFDKDIQEQVALDSMQYVAILARIEEKLKTNLPLSLMQANTINEFLELVERELKKK